MKVRVCRELHTESYWNIVDGQGVRKEELKNGIYTCILGGGLICALVQILLDRTKLMPGRIMVLSYAPGRFWEPANCISPCRIFAGAGASVPLSGFGNLLWKGVKEAVDREGFIGIFFGRLQGKCSRNQRRADLRISRLFFCSVRK